MHKSHGKQQYARHRHGQARRSAVRLRHYGRQVALLAGGVLLLQAAIPQLALAHAFGIRYDLPVPLNMYMAGAGAAILLTFVLAGFFVRGAWGTHDYPRVDLFRWAGFRWLGSPWFVRPVKTVAFAFFVLIIATGLAGKANPQYNLAPTLVWIIWWVGMAYISALVGNIWPVLNPWKTGFEAVEWAYRKVAPGRRFGLGLPYPARWGVWPGVLLFFLFAWTELDFPSPANPPTLAIIILIFSIMNWGGMYLFGKDKWLQSGEPFSLVFGLFARFSPTEVRVADPATCAACPLDCAGEDGQCVNCYHCFGQAPGGSRGLYLRPYAVGLLRTEGLSASTMALVLVMLATVTFDGFKSTPAWVTIENSLYSSLSFFGSQALTTADTVGMIGFTALVVGAYLLFASLMEQFAGDSRSTRRLAEVFAFSLLPIAFAYHLAHYLTYILIAGQNIIRLVSDPFGAGWNLFGTANYQVNIGIIGAREDWYTAVIAIVLGHVIAVVLAHIQALRSIPSHRAALRSQYPMVFLMVGYTVLSLWILAQPIMESR